MGQSTYVTETLGFVLLASTFRAIRLQYHGAFYHVMAGGNCRESALVAARSSSVRSDCRLKAAASRTHSKALGARRRCCS
jgi:hypothetical protein